MPGQGSPAADPLAGLAIFAVILVLASQSARSVIFRMLDAVAAEIVEAPGHAARHVPMVEDVTDVSARWVGHRLHAEISITVAASLSVREGHEVAKQVRHQPLHHVPHLGGVSVPVDPSGGGGRAHHRVLPHPHDGLRVHGHE